MEKTRQIKILSIVALVVAIAGMTLGFAAFSTTLSISSSATVTPNSEDFKVVLSSNSNYGDPIHNVIEPSIVGDASANAIIINNVGNTFTTNINVNFESPGSSVLYTMFVHNVGKYDAYFNKIVFDKVSGSELKKVCSIPSDSNATPELVEQACDGIKFSVGVFNYTKYVYFTDDYYFNSIILKPGQVGSGKFLIEYGSDAVRADGPFNVQFGDITLEYNTVD